MKLYAAVGFAQKIDVETTTTNAFPMAILAHSEEEAIGKAYMSMKEDYPIEDGWTSHAAGVTQVPHEMIAAVTQEEVE